MSELPVLCVIKVKNAVKKSNGIVMSGSLDGVGGGGYYCYGKLQYGIEDLWLDRASIELLLTDRQQLNAGKKPTSDGRRPGRIVAAIEAGLSS